MQSIDTVQGTLYIKKSNIVFHSDKNSSQHFKIFKTINYFL